MTLTITGEVWYWKGPAPYYFVTVPEEASREIKAVERLVTYGWGMIPATVRLGGTEWKTALWPKDGKYIVPLRDRVRKVELTNEGDLVTVSVEIALDPDAAGLP